MSLWQQLKIKINRFPNHTMCLVGKDYIRIIQDGYGSGVYDLGSLGDAIENCPEDVKRYVVLHRAYSLLLRAKGYTK